MKRDSEIEETSLVISPTVKESNASSLGNGDGGNEGMIEIGAESRERKKSRYLSYPYVNWGQKGLSVEGMAATTDSGPNLEITLLNPIWIHSATTDRVSGKPFYAILHRIDVGVVIDLEPARTEDPALSIAGAVQSQKLAVRAISQLQSLPCGDIKLLCDTVVESVRELTGYDRVMVYKFHEDEHGEVLAEVGELGLLLT